MKYLPLILAAGMLTSITTAAPARKKSNKAETSVCIPRSNGIFSLHEAAATGNEEILRKRLSEPQHKIDQLDEFGNTPLSIATAAKNQKLVSLLKEAGATTSSTGARIVSHRGKSF